MNIPKEDGTCGCGSGELPEWNYDGYGIPLFKACEKCWAKERKKYRVDVFEQYDTDGEPIEPEE